MIKSKIPRLKKNGGGNVSSRDPSAHTSDQPSFTSDSDALSSDVTYNSDCQSPSSPDDEPDSPGLGDIGEYTVAEDEESDPQQLQKAIEEMARLDALLLSAACKEKMAKRQLKDSKSKLWHDLQVRLPYGHNTTAKEAKNTEMFLALDTTLGADEREDIAASPPSAEGSEPELSRWSPDSPLFSTADPMRKLGEGEKEFGEMAVSSGQRTLPGKPARTTFDHLFDEHSLDQKDDDEAEDGEMVMTEAEKARLAELLWDINGEGDSERNVSMANGYTPGDSEIEALREIDAKLRNLLSDEEYISVQSTFTSTLEGP